MKNFIKKYPALFAGFWFAGFGVIACSIVFCLVFLPPKSFGDIFLPAVPSFLSGFLLGSPLIKCKKSGLRAILLGVIIGVLAVYLVFVESIILAPSSASGEKIYALFLAFKGVLGIFTSFLGVPVIVIGGLAGWTLQRFAQRMELCQK